MRTWTLTSLGLVGWLLASAPALADSDDRRPAVGGKSASVHLGAVAVPTPTHPDFEVRTPDVNVGELSVGSLGEAGFDPRAARNGEQSYTAELEYGVTSGWQTSLEVEFERDSGSGETTNLSQVTSENLFQFTERGEYWLDAGFFAAYSLSLHKGDPNQITLGPVLRKDFWGLSNTLNVFVEKDMGHNSQSQPPLLLAWETRFDALTMQFGDRFSVEPGFQYYGAPGRISNFAKWDNEDNRIGPQMFGAVHDLGPGTLEWNAGLLVGVTRAAPKLTPRWQFEYEIHY